jgi:hypothetical protein
MPPIEVECVVMDDNDIRPAAMDVGQPHLDIGGDQPLGRQRREDLPERGPDPVVRFAPGDPRAHDAVDQLQRAGVGQGLPLGLSQDVHRPSRRLIGIDGLVRVQLVHPDSYAAIATSDTVKLRARTALATREVPVKLVKDREADRSAR